MPGEVKSLSHCQSLRRSSTLVVIEILRVIIMSVTLHCSSSAIGKLRYWASFGGHFNYEIPFMF